MKIDASAALLQQAEASRKSNNQESGQSFAEMMASSVAASDVGASQGLSTAAGGDAEQGAVDTIREKGFRAYVEELQARKMEEMRKEILDRMGLTEEDLKNMPAERRDAIEKMIAQEIQRRMEAAAHLNGKDRQGAPDPAETARAIGGVNGTGGAGTALLAVIEQRDAGGGTPADTGNLLPGKREKDSGFSS